MHRKQVSVRSNRLLVVFEPLEFELTLGEVRRNDADCDGVTEADLGPRVPPVISGHRYEIPGGVPKFPAADMHIFFAPTVNKSSFRQVQVRAPPPG